MGYTTIEEIGRYEGQTVTVKGWLYNKRVSKNLVFLLVRDGTGILQSVLYKPDLGEESFDAAGKLPQESSLMVEGVVKADPRAPGGYELSVKTFTVLAETLAEYPISPKEHGVGFLMEHRHLWLRSRRQFATLRIRHEIISAIRDFLNDRGFINLDAPIFTPNACEGTSTLFQTDYFGDKAFLTQSGQLYMEAGAAAFGKVYCFGPTFRAEKSKTRRHLTEFWMLEPEVAFLDLEGDMELAEDLLMAILARVLERRKAELEILERDLEPLRKIQKPFVRLSYTDAIAKLKSLGSDIQDGDDLGGDDETILTKEYDRPLIVHHYPAEVKAFYMRKDPANPTFVENMDVLAPEGYGEIIGGSVREHSFDELMAAIRRHNLPEDAFAWYLDLRRYGSFPHAGFGLGLERTVAWICGTHHVRECIPFPRMLDKIYP